MKQPHKLERFEQPLGIDGVELSIAGLRREGTAAPIVFLHGFGSTKEDYADVVQHAVLEEHAVLAYDAPGCGGSASSDLSSGTIPFLLATAERMLDAAGVDRFHLVGHSMGGLTALLLADRYPDRVLSFTDIEGNLAPEDCFLSRQILTHPAEDPEEFLANFRDRAAEIRLERTVLGEPASQGARRGRAGDLRLHGRALRQRRLAREVPRVADAADVHVRRAEPDALLPADAARAGRGAGRDHRVRPLPDVLQPAADVVAHRAVRDDRRTSLLTSLHLPPTREATRIAGADSPWLQSNRGTKGFLTAGTSSSSGSTSSSRCIRRSHPVSLASCPQRVRRIQMFGDRLYGTSNHHRPIVITAIQLIGP